MAGIDPQLSALVAAWDGRPEEFSRALRLAEQRVGEPQTSLEAKEADLEIG